MALRRHTHFTAAARPKKQPTPDCLLQNRKIVAKTRRFSKVQAAFAPYESSLHKQKPRCRSNGIE